MPPQYSVAALDEALGLYERIAITGARDAIVLDRLTLISSASVQQRLRVLIGLGLLEVDGAELRLPPLEGTGLAQASGLDDGVVRRLIAQQAYWEDWRPARDDGAVLHGGRGYWEHWWNLVQTWDRPEPMAMDAVMPARPGFWGRNWLEFIHRGWLETLTGSGRMAVRLIVPEGAVGSVAVDLVDLVRTHLGEVRILDSAEWFTVYGGRALVVPEELGDEFDGESRLVTQRQIVTAFQERFDLQWAASRPWGVAGQGATSIPERVLRMLATGLEDERIAAQLGITARTVRRHVAKAMADAGARTRFQLGAIVGGGATEASAEPAEPVVLAESADRADPLGPGSGGVL